jgi:ATP-dependent protease ClpP protease subunit
MVHHIYIYGVVGKDITSKKVVDQINSSKPVKGDTVLAHIHSKGGVVHEGYAIHDALVSLSNTLGFKLETQAEGECKSIATVIFLAANVRKITTNTEFMIHNPWGGLEGGSQDFKNYAKELESIENSMSKFYSEKISIRQDVIKDLMAKETFYNAEEALKMGFATEIVNTMKAVALFKGNKSKTNNQKQMSTFSLQGFKASLKKALDAISNGETLALDASLEDGTMITIGTEAETPSVGDMVTFTDSGEAVPDASHVLTDGTVIVTVDGVITEINPEVETTEEEVAALQAEVRELKKALAEVQPILNAVAKATSKAAPKAQTRVRSVVKPNASTRVAFTKEDIKSNKRRAQAK